MNRETKRMLQRQGTLKSDGTPAVANRAPLTRDPNEKRPSVPEFISQVRVELKKVIWPTRAEVKGYTIVVVVTILIMTAITFGFDWVYAKSVFQLYTR